MSNKIDKKYLSLQFWKKVHEKNGSEFQNLFSEVMQKAYPSAFQKIKPYGKLGDGGNDGYIPSKGIYYQVYAPESPAEKSSDAAKKMVGDFNKLRSSGWNEISKIREYNFVFNDKNNGLDIVIESARAQLAHENPDITFRIFLPHELEETFLNLNDNQLIALGFDVDQRKTLEITRVYLKGLEVELDRGHAQYVSQALDTMREIITTQGDEALSLDFEIIEARTFQRLEKVEEAKKKYKNIYARFPKDARAPLYLAELYLNADNYEENQKLLDAVKGIDCSHWLYTLEILVRKVFLKEAVSITDVDTNSFPSDNRAKSDYYRIYANLLRNSGDTVNALSFAEQAVHYNPEKISSYDAKIALEFDSLPSVDGVDKQREKIDALLQEIDDVSNKFNASGNIGNRNRVYLNYKKAVLLVQSERFDDFTPVAKEIFELIFSCYFDNIMDGILTDMLAIVSLPKDELAKLLIYLNAGQKPLSDALAKRMFLQFLEQGTLETAGKKFFTDKKLEHFSTLIDDYGGKDFDTFVSRIKDDNHFAIMLCMAINEPTLRKKIVEALPDNEGIHKDKLYLLLEDDSGNLDGAFALLKKMDLSQIGYVESQKFLSIAKRKEAWDFVITFADKLLTYEKEARRVLQIKLELFTANLNLERLPETAKIGEELLENRKYMELLDEKNKTILLCQTVSSLLRRNNTEDNNSAKTLIEKYRNYLSDFESNALLASEVYLRHNDAKSALECVMRGVKLARRPSPQEYASLFMVFHTVGELLDLNLDSAEQVVKDSFVKFKEEEVWYFVGSSVSLDAQAIPANKQDYILGKKQGENVVFANDYISEKKEKTIENILSVEKYVAWQTYHHFQKLSLEGMWDTAVSIEVPSTEDGDIDLKNIIALMEAQHKRGQEFFNTYCKQNLPFAMLAASEGGLTGAVGRILNEQQGFVKMSDGTLAEFSTQKEIAKKVIDKKQEFYIDGTSAWILAETGLLTKLHKHIPNLKVPQSVISLLLSIKDKLSYSPGQVGQMYYSKGKLGMSEVSLERIEAAKKKVADTIALLETNSEKISVISSANKEDVFSEQQVLASLCDATVLAQKENIPVLTEDFLYLHLNELETKKQKPTYFSSLALMRVLYEQGRVNFEEYLDFFSYLAGYRFRFLFITVEDMEKAIFGDGVITIVNVENLKKLHLSLTLSAEYGVDPQSATKLVLHFILKLLIDDSVSSEVVEQVFTEIVYTFPTNKDRNLLGRALISTAVKIINENQGIFVGMNTQAKVDALVRVSERFISTAFIIQN